MGTIWWEETIAVPAAQEAERPAAPAGDESGLLADGPYPEEALGHVEHQRADRLGLAVDDRARPGPVSHRRHRLCSL